MFTDDDVEAGAQNLRGSPLDEVERRTAARAVLESFDWHTHNDAVAARALREAADDSEHPECKRWLEWRAEQVNE